MTLRCDSTIDLYIIAKASLTPRVDRQIRHSCIMLTQCILRSIKPRINQLNFQCTYHLICFQESTWKIKRENQLLEEVCFTNLKENVCFKNPKAISS